MHENKSVIIGVTGPSRAGKDTLTEHFKRKYGAMHLSVSDEMAKVLKERGLPYTRENLINVGNELREKNGADYFARRLLLRAFGIGGIQVIGSLRNTEEVKTIQKVGFVIAVNADINTRYDRTKNDKNGKDTGTFEEFERKDAFERDSGIPSGQNIGKCMEMANYHLTNNGTPEEFYAQIDKVCGVIFQAH